MEAAYLNWVLFVCIFAAFGAANDSQNDDVTPEDLKLLSDYQLRRIADFVKRKGSVSKVSFEELSKAANQDEDSQISDLFGDIPGTLGAEAGQDLNDFNTDRLDSQDSNVFSVGRPPVILAEMISTSKPSNLHEHLVIPNILTPPPRLHDRGRTRNPPRKTISRSARPRTQTPPSPPPEPLTTTVRALTSEDFKLFARVLQEIKHSKLTLLTTTPHSTPSPPTTKAAVPTTNSTTPSPFLHQGRPLIIEQQDPEFQEFVVTPLSEKWKGLANKVSSRGHSSVPLTLTAIPSSVSALESATFTISTPVNPAVHQSYENFGLQKIALKPSKIVTTPAPSTTVPLLEEFDLTAISDIAILRKLFSDYLTHMKNKKDVEDTLSKGSYRVVKSSKRENTISLPVSPADTVTPTAARISKAYVTILREGFMHDTSDTEFTLVATITVIRDDGKVILVDTGLATDINGRTDLIQKLSKLHIAPPMVDIVIMTHGHADHSGNANDFPDSIHYQGEFTHYRTKFNFNKLANANFTELTQNVKLLRTPGHTADSISVIVRNTDQYGTVAIVGDTFFSEKDLDFPILWKRFAADTRLQDDSRRKLICEANYIVPGHGKAFQVTPMMKHGANCGTRTSNNYLRSHRTLQFE